VCQKRPRLFAPRGTRETRTYRLVRLHCSSRRASSSRRVATRRDATSDRTSRVRVSRGVGQGQIAAKDPGKIQFPAGHQAPSAQAVASTSGSSPSLCKKSQETGRGWKRKDVGLCFLMLLGNCSSNRRCGFYSFGMQDDGKSVVTSPSSLRQKEREREGAACTPKTQHPSLDQRAICTTSLRSPVPPPPRRRGNYFY